MALTGLAGPGDHCCVATRVSARFAVRAVVLVILAITLLGCVIVGRGGGIGFEPSSPEPGSAVPDRSDTNAGGQSRGQSLEGAFSYHTMDDYLEAVTPMITQWIRDTWPGMRAPTVVYVPRGVSGFEDCLDRTGRVATYSSRSYEYCGADQTIYVGQDMLWTFYNLTGDAGPAVGLAHEFGHHIQQRLGVPGPRTLEQSVRYENQADCLAGAWTAYTDRRGWLEYPDDIQDIEALFPLIGSAEGFGRDHGTARERAAAFQAGLDGGVEACGVPTG